MKNQILNIATVLFTFNKAILIGISIFLLGIFIHFQNNPEFYADYSIIENHSKKPIILINNKFELGIIENYSNIHHEKEIKEYKIDSISNLSLYLMFFQCIITIALMYLIVSNLQKIVWSVKDKQTFHTKNVRLFRDIGHYLLINLIITSTFYIKLEDRVFSDFSLDSSNLYLIVLAYILAEVFKEGNKLYEENELTV